MAMTGIPGPGAALRLARSTVGWVTGSAAAVGAVPGRVFGLLAGTEALLERISTVVSRADALVDRAERAVGDAEHTVGRVREVVVAAAEIVEQTARVAGTAATVVAGAGEVSDEAADVVARAGRTARSADELLARYEPLALRAAPLAERFVEELSEDEVNAAIRLVDQLPVLTEHVLSDVLPILATLDRVGPEISELLEVTRDVRRAILGVPGFGFFRRRGEGRADEGEAAERDGARPS
jgi:hypothetical protein